MAGLPGKTVALGSPQSSIHQISQVQLADWMTEIEGLTGLSGFAFVRGSAAALSGLGTDNDYALVVTTAAERGIYQRASGSWSKVSDLPLILSESLAADQAEGDRILAQAAAVSADDDATAAAASATAAASSQSLADVARTQAQLAAVAAGATLYASVAAGEADTVDGDVFLVSTEPGVQVYENDTGTGTFFGWLGEVLLDDVAVVKAWTPPAYPQTGLIVRTRKDGFAYSVLASGATDEDITTTGGVKLRVLPNSDGTTNATQWGWLADTTETVIGTDNAAQFQKALDSGHPLAIPTPPAGFAYGVSQVSLPRHANITGPGQNVLAIRGTTPDATLTAGTSYGDLKREITIRDLYVENNRSGIAADIQFCTDFNLERVYFRSVTNSGLGTTAQAGLNLKNSERGNLSGQCRFGGNPALRIVKDCNAIRGDNVVASGGSAGLAVDISGCQNVRLPLTIETSLQGVRISDNTGANATDGGWCSGIDLSNSYFESVGTPVVAGAGFACQGLDLSNCWLNNHALSDGSPFPVSANMLDIGRVKNLYLSGGRWVGAGTETALRMLDAVVTSGAAPGYMESAIVDLTVFESIAALIDSTTITGLGDRATAAASNRVWTNDARTTGLGIPFEWVSPPIAANTGYNSRRIDGPSVAGGRITSVELIEGNGSSLDGARVLIGSETNASEILDVTFGAVSHAYFDFGVTSGLRRGANNHLLFQVSAGTGTGTFRIRVSGVIGS